MLFGGVVEVEVAIVGGPVQNPSRIFLDVVAVIRGVFFHIILEDYVVLGLNRLESTMLSNSDYFSFMRDIISFSCSLNTSPGLGFFSVGFFQ